MRIVDCLQRVCAAAPWQKVRPLVAMAAEVGTPLEPGDSCGPDHRGRGDTAFV